MLGRMGLISAVALALAGCATVPAQRASEEVQILAINDFHGNLEPAGGAVEYVGTDGARQSARLGGAAWGWKSPRSATMNSTRA